MFLFQEAEETTKEHLKLQAEVTSLLKDKEKLENLLYNHECVMYGRKIIFYE